jgi:hypothetical protein
MGAECSRFLVGPSTRITEIEEWLDELEQMPPHEAIVRRLTHTPTGHSPA